jgi:hypothetical protein
MILGFFGVGFMIYRKKKNGFALSAAEPFPSHNHPECRPFKGGLFRDLIWLNAEIVELPAGTKLSGEPAWSLPTT